MIRRLAFIVGLSASTLAGQALAQDSNLGGGLVEFLVRGLSDDSRPAASGPVYQMPAPPPPVYDPRHTAPVPPPVVYRAPPSPAYDRQAYGQQAPQQGYYYRTDRGAYYTPRPQVQPQYQPQYAAPPVDYRYQQAAGGYLMPQQQPAPAYIPQPEPPRAVYGQPPQPAYAPPMRQAAASPPAANPMRTIDPKYLKQEVDYDGPEKPGTIVINTPERFLYLVQADGRALRYGIGVGRPGFQWAGEHRVTSKREWPDWIPPKEMLERQPYLPRRMAGGPDNPLGARALYLGSTLYRIHGSNEPWTIGHAVSSGCIRMRNEDVIDLYGRVQVGTKVIVI